MSKIEWTDRTINPIVGCSPISIGCKNCYARRMAQQLAGQGYLQYVQTQLWDGSVYYLGRKWFEEKVKKIPAGSRVFVCSMGDLFHKNVKDEWFIELCTVMSKRSDLTFQLLTKRAKEMRQRLERLGWSNPPNIQLGVTVETQELADERILELLKIPAAVRFVSCEPLLGRITLRECFRNWERQTGLDWVIVGGETGPNRRFVEEVLYEYVCREYGALSYWEGAAHWLCRQCKQAGIPFFFKKPPGGGKLGEDGFTLNTPEDLKIREFPK